MALNYQPVYGVPSNGVGYPDADSNAYWSTSMQTPFANIIMYAVGGSGGSTSSIVLGGIQSFDPVEDAPTRSVFQSGSQWIEFVMQPREWTVACTRVFPRGYDIRSMLHQVYSRVHDMDFRQLPVYLGMNYLQYDPSGNHLVEGAFWTWAMGTFQRVRGPYWTDAVGEMREDWTWKGRGIYLNRASASDTGTWGNDSVYYGAAPHTGA